MSNKDIHRKLLIYKGAATCKALEAFPMANARLSFNFASEYNHYREMVVGLLPDLVEVAPPKIEFTDDTGSPFCEFIDIYVYYLQLVEMLKNC